MEKSKEIEPGTTRILVVESFGSNVKSLSSHLSSFPFLLEIVSASDAASAISRLQREAFDLAIIDSCLKGKTDGYELCRFLRESLSPNNDIPIILILSGYLSLERAKGISAGADLLLHRPVVKEELLRMMQLLLGWRFEARVNVSASGLENRGPRRLHVESPVRGA